MAKGLPGAKYTIIRTLAMVLNFICVLLTIVFIGVGIGNAQESFVMFIIPIVGGVAFGLLIKVEIDFIDDHRPLLLLVTATASMIIQIVLAFTVAHASILRVFVFYFTSLAALFVLIICWHYTLTIYKKEKLRFFIAFLVFEILWVGFAYIYIGLILLVNAILVAFAIVMVTFAERILISKKLLTYI